MSWIISTIIRQWGDVSICWINTGWCIKICAYGLSHIKISAYGMSHKQISQLLVQKHPTFRASSPMSCLDDVQLNQAVVNGVAEVWNYYYN